MNGGRNPLSEVKLPQSLAMSGRQGKVQFSIIQKYLCPIASNNFPPCGTTLSITTMEYKRFGLYERRKMI